jgi:two-component system sensor histidine kinase KdpD
VSTTVNIAARRTRQAARAAAESRTLANLAGSVLGGEQALTEMLERVRETFALRGATLLERDDDTWQVVAGAGEAVASPGQADTDVPAGEGVVLALVGGSLQADDQRLVGAFAAQAAVVLDRIRLSRAAAEAAPLAEANKLRTALLTAVSHDFRTPLAAAKAAVSSLSSAEIEDRLSPEDRRELLAAAETSLDRLADLVDNLLDMSRLQAGAMSVAVQPTAVEEVVARALDDVGHEGAAFVVELGEEVPFVLADPGLLERVVANLATNALRYSEGAPAPRVTCSAIAERVEVRVIDRGPGIPREQWADVFLPFQRLGDTDNSSGVGLGLALARGLTEAMGGTLRPEETPGGGLTMVIALPAAPGLALAPGRRERDEARP